LILYCFRRIVDGANVSVLVFPGSLKYCWGFRLKSELNVKMIGLLTDLKIAVFDVKDMTTTY
jgi:hypothetical protein